MIDTVLVLSSGPSSLKYALLEPDSGTPLAVGIVERIRGGLVVGGVAGLPATPGATTG